MPLPLALDHINLYLIEDEEGWYVVDTGMKGSETQEYWKEIFENGLEGKPIIGVIVTHQHPDHVGQAGWICDQFEVPLFMTRAEFQGARVMSEIPPGLSWTSERFMRRHSTPESRIEAVRNSKFRMREMIEPIPMAYRRLKAGDHLDIGGHRWRVYIGEGHSPEHACLFCEDLNVLLSGDQVIARITPNVSVMPMEPEANPMKAWLSTLKQFYSLPKDVLVLPSHHLPFIGLHERLEQIITHHEDHMVALERACEQPKTTRELLPVLFKRELHDSQLTMALGECIAHLHLLMERELVTRTLGDDGRYRFHTRDPKLAERETSPGYDGDDLPQMV